MQDQLAVRRGYFVSDEAEKAAMVDMYRELKSKQSHLALLEQQAERIGRDLERFGRALSNPSWTFRASEGSLEGKHTTMDDSQISLPLRTLDPDGICRLISDIQETKETISTLRRRLREAGFEC